MAVWCLINESDRQNDTHCHGVTAAYAMPFGSIYTMFFCAFYIAYNLSPVCAFAFCATGLMSWVVTKKYVFRFTLGFLKQNLLWKPHGGRVVTIIILKIAKYICNPRPTWKRLNQGNIKMPFIVQPFVHCLNMFNREVLFNWLLYVPELSLPVKLNCHLVAKSDRCVTRAQRQWLKHGDFLNAACSFGTCPC